MSQAKLRMIFTKIYLHISILVKIVPKKNKHFISNAVPTSAAVRHHWFIHSGQCSSVRGGKNLIFIPDTVSVQYGLRLKKEVRISTIACKRLRVSTSPKMIDFKSDSNMVRSLIARVRMHDVSLESS